MKLFGWSTLDEGMILMAATAEDVRRTIHGKTIQALAGEWRVSVLDAQMAASSTMRVLELNLVGPTAFNLRLEIAGEALSQLRRDQELGSWVLQKLSTYLAYNPGVRSGDSGELVVREP
jgi:hypothetical protein